eukprot:m.71067 g.71067  ORF g.71067 m.71067 type:complete len:1220 (-) comp7618_c0_seq1:135-3794(-)
MGEETVKVLVRCRPLNAREKGLNCKTIVSMEPSIGQVALEKPDAADEPPKTFSFDGVYDRDSCTRQIYEDLVFPLVEGVLEGYNGTVFAYGQTGCGKSFSMEGIADSADHRGITPRSFEHVFQEVAVRSNTKFLVRASYLEIYNENVRDLLAKDTMVNLELKEHPEKGVYVKDLSMNIVHNADEVQRFMARGSTNRAVGATAMNADSSRSHSIFTLYIEMCENQGGEDKIRAGKLNLVDLAGSERQSKTQAEGARLKEATKINLSLSALGNVISALVDGKAKHIPYRDSKLTRLLQDSLGGNTKTLMVACLSPADNNYDETLSTLRYANRAKNIKNKAVINEDPKDALLREYQEEIQRLKEMLMGKVPLDPNFLANLGAGMPALAAPAAAPPPKIIEKIVTKEIIVEKIVHRDREDPAPAKGGDKSEKTEKLEKAEKAEKIEKVEKTEKKSSEPKSSGKSEPKSKSEPKGKSQSRKAPKEEDDAASHEAAERIRAQKAAEMEAMENELKRKYDGKFAELEQMYTEQKMTNEKLEEEFERVSRQFEEAREALQRDNKAALETALSAIPSHLAVSQSEHRSPRVSSASSNKVPGGGPPPFAYAVVGEAGQVVPALIGPDGLPIEAKMAPSGEVIAVCDEDGNTKVVLGPDGQPAPQVIVIDEPVAVVGPDGDAVLAIRGEYGQPIKAEMGSDGLLRPMMRIDGYYDEILGPDGLPAREVAMPRGRTQKLRYKPTAVIGPDGKPMLAVIDNGVAVQAHIAPDGLLVPIKGIDGNSIPIKGPNGAAPRKVQAAVAAVACRTLEGETVVGAVGNNGTLIKAEMTEEGIMRPVLGPDGDHEIVRDVIVPIVRPPPEPAEPADPELLAIEDALDEVPDDFGTTTSVPAAPAVQPAEQPPPSGAAEPPSETDLVAQLRRKLMELEGQVVAGGELAGNQDLKANLDSKRKKAREKEMARLRAAKDGDDDTALEEIYGTMQDELRAKTKKLTKMTDKLKAAKAEIADLQGEFERERDDLLETVRKQQQQLKLHQQMLERVQPLIRRECNYSNIERIMGQAQWSEDIGEWLLPKVQSGSAAPASHSAGSGGHPLRASNDANGSPRMTRHPSSAHNEREYRDAREDEAYRDHLRTNANAGASYFQPKRAAQLLDNLEQRQREATMQQEQRLSRFDNMRPITSNRSMQLLQQDPLASLDNSPRNRRRDQEPGGVSLSFGAPRGRRLGRPGID